MGGCIARGVLVLLFPVGADRRTRGRGSRDSGGAKDTAAGKYI